MQPFHLPPKKERHEAALAAVPFFLAVALAVALGLAWAVFR